MKRRNPFFGIFFSTLLGRSKDQKEVFMKMHSEIILLLLATIPSGEALRNFLGQLTQEEQERIAYLTSGTLSGLEFDELLEFVGERLAEENTH
jgi:hypothetical protein